MTDPAGIIGNKVRLCQTQPCDINPNVPNRRQITGLMDIVMMWSPLYGKINVVSELDVNVPGVALALDLLDEIEALRSQLQRVHRRR